MGRWPIWLACIITATPVAGQMPSAEERINRVVTAYMEREGVPGVSVVAMRGEQLVLSRSWGLRDATARSPMTVQAIQPYYSVSKQMTAAVVLKLVEAGLVDLDASVGEYLPEWFTDEPGLRVHHLLRHTSGIPDFTGLPEVRALEAAPAGTGSLSTLLDIIGPLPRRFLPGQRHSYSNTNYTALALIAERVSGRAFAELQRTLLFSQLGLAGADECWVLLDGTAPISPGHSDEGAPAYLPSNLQPSFTGNGGVCGSAKDLARWTRSLASGEVIGSAIFEEMLRPAPVLEGYEAPYGFGLSTLRVAERPAFSHGGVGDGWGAWAAYLPGEELTIVVLANRGWLWLTDAGIPIIRALLQDPDRPPLHRNSLSTVERVMLTGDFEDGLFELRLEAGSDRVIVHVAAFGEPIELWKQDDGDFISPRRPDTFSLRLVGSRIEFDWAEHRSYLSRRQEPAAR